MAQSRTEEGLKKNATWRHKLAYKSIDLEPFRIICVVKKERYVLATASTEDEIMLQWEELHSVLEHDRRHADPELLSPTTWPTICNEILSSRRSKRPSAASPSPTKQRNIAQARNPELPSVPRAEQHSESEAPLTICEAWVVRVLRAWSWNNILQSTVLFFLFLHGAIYQWMNLPAATAVVVACGLPMSSDGALEPSEVELNRLASIKSFLVRWRLHEQNRMQSLLCSAVLFDSVCSAVFPGGRYLVGLIEVCVTATITTTMLFSLFTSRILGRVKKPASPASPGDVVRRRTRSRIASVAPEKEEETSPEPSQPEDESLAKILEPNRQLFISDDWELKQEKDGVKFYMKTVPWCGKKACWFTTFVPNSTPQTMESILNEDFEGKDKNSPQFAFDNLLLGKEVCERFDDGRVLLRSEFKSPVMGVSARDMVSIMIPSHYLSENEQRRWRLRVSDDDLRQAPEVFERCVFVSCGVDPSKVGRLKSVPNAKGFVRGTVHNVAYIAQRVADGTNIHLCMSIDPSGLIPSKFVDVVNSEQIEKMKVIRRLMIDKGPVDPDESIAHLPQSPGVRSGSKSKFKDDDDDPILVHMMKCMKREGWVEKSNKDGITHKECPVPWADTKALWFTTVIQGTSPEALEATLCDDPEGTNTNANCYRFDRLLQNRELIRRLDNGHVVMRTTYKSPVMFIGPREMCTLVQPGLYLTREQQEKWDLLPSDDDVDPVCFVQCGMEPPDDLKPAELKGYVRGASHVFGMFARNVSEGTEVNFVLSMDPKGGIPTKLIEATNAEQKEKLKIVTQIMKERGVVSRSSSSSEGGSPKRRTEADSEQGAEVPDTVVKYLKLLQSSDWSLVKEKNGVRFSQKEVSFSPIKACYLTLNVPGVNCDVVRRLFTNVDTGKLYDRLMDSKRVVRQIDDNTAILHTKYKSPVWGIAARDMVTYATTEYFMPREYQEKYTVVPEGAEDKEDSRVFFHCGYDWSDKEVKAEKGFTRSKVFHFGFMAQERPDGSIDLHNCFAMDPCGSIPKSIVDGSNAEQMNKMEIIAKLLKEDTFEKQVK